MRIRGTGDQAYQPVPTSAPDHLGTSDSVTCARLDLCGDPLEIVQASRCTDYFWLLR